MLLSNHRTRRGLRYITYYHILITREDDQSEGMKIQLISSFYPNIELNLLAFSISDSVVFSTFIQEMFLNLFYNQKDIMYYVLF